MSSSKKVVVIGAGLGGLTAALELRRRGLEPVVLERREVVGGKASVRSADGFRWDEGPSILVMPWVYEELFESNGIDMGTALPMRRLDPAFKIVLSSGRPIEIPCDPQGLADAFAQIDPHDGLALPKFLAKMDHFARVIAHAYCDRILENWGQVLLSPLARSAAVVSPAKSYVKEINEFFRSAEVRELLYGFPTFSGFSPEEAPASLAILPWTIIREGVWYPVRGGIGAIPKAIEADCRAKGIEIRTGVEVEAIERDATGWVTGVSTSSGPIQANWVLSNGDYVHTMRMLRGGPGFTKPTRTVREGQAEPSTSFLTLQLGCDRDWAESAHHLLVLTEGSSRVYDELYVRGEYPADPPIYANVTSKTDPSDAPEGGSNPFIVIGAPPLPMDESERRDVLEAHADRLIARLEAAGQPGFAKSIVSRTLTTPRDFRDRFLSFRGSIYGLGTKHNVLGGGFRPLNYLAEVPGLYLAGGGVQPGAGMPMVIQSGKIAAERLAKDHRILGGHRPKPVAGKV